MGINTEQFAAQRLVKPESVISRLSRTGSYFGVRPHKLKNGRLLWPDVGPDSKPHSPQRIGKRPPNKPATPVQLEFDFERQDK